MSVLGLDVGTSATKGVLLDDGGRVLAQDRRGYRVRVPEHGRSELPAPRVWVAVRRAIASLAAAGERAGSPVRAVCVGGSGDEVVATDARGRAVGPVIMTPDRRSAAEGVALAAAEGADALFRRTGLWDLGVTPMARWRWMGRQRPADAARVARLLSWPEWVMTRLGLPAMVDPTLAARTLAYDLATGTYADATDRASLAGLLSPIVPTGTLVDAIPAARADSVGLRPGTRYVVGGFDQAMASLGAGAIEAGVAHDGNGSWEALSMRVPRDVIDDRLRTWCWSVGPAASGPHVEVMASWLAGLARPRPGMAPESAYAGLADRLAGAIRQLAELGLPVARIRATGGGAASDDWLQRKADATGLLVERPATRQAGALAAAILAGSAIDLLPPVEDAVRAHATVEARFEPRPEGAPPGGRQGVPAPPSAR
ncbi:MAG: FGGY family carbohydrate kinase, partial [Chloroflexota bacterium]